MKSELFRRAISGLAHPFTVGAILLILLNDNILKYATPSWLTGKLSDFAWLAFVPFLVAILLTCLVPFKRLFHHKVIGWLAFGLTGSSFALIKTVPFFHTLVVNVLSHLAAFPVNTRLDPTDLIALPILAVSWHIWNVPVYSAPARSKVGYVMLIAGSLAAIGETQDTPNYGISCLQEKGTSVIAYVVGEADVYPFVSIDGGLSWNEDKSGQYSKEFTGCTLPNRVNNRPPWEISDPTHRQILYRFYPGVSIERSDNSGQTWKQEFDLTRIYFPARRYYEENINTEGRQKLYYGDIYAWPGPLDAIVSVNTGSVIATMGQDGVLVRTLDGKWQWVSVGPYQLREASWFEIAITLLPDEVPLAIATASLVIAILICILQVSRGANRNLSRFSLLPIMTCVLVWGINTLVIDHSLTNIVYIVLTLYVIVLSLLSCVIMLFHYATQILMISIYMLAIGLSAIVVEMTPYFLWSQGVISDYDTATKIAMIAAIAHVPIVFYLLRGRILFSEVDKSKSSAES